MVFESIEVRRAANGFVVVVNTEDDNKEYVYDTARKAMRFIKGFLDTSKELETE